MNFDFTGLYVKTAGTGHKIIAFADLSDQTVIEESTTFDITYGTATTLEFGAVSGGTVLTDDTVTITAKDAYGNTDAGFISVINVSSTSGTTSNYTPAAATSGTITYSNIQVNKSGNQ